MCGVLDAFSIAITSYYRNSSKWPSNCYGNGMVTMLYTGTSNYYGPLLLW